MYRIGRYDADDRMCDLVCDSYPVLLVMSRFGIALGFGDKTIGEVCRDSGVDTGTFLTVVNTHIDGEAPDPGAVSVGALVGYLRNSHDYFLDFRLPGIRRKLIEAIDCSRNDVAFASCASSTSMSPRCTSIWITRSTRFSPMSKPCLPESVPKGIRSTFSAVITISRGQARRTEAHHHPLLSFGKHQRAERRAF